MPRDMSVMQILSPRGGSGLGDAGRDLLRRLKASGSPVVGQDAFILSQMLASGDIPPKFVLAICEYLGYLPPGDYPFTRVKEGEQKEYDRNRPLWREREQRRVREREARRVRTRRTRALDGEEGSPQRESRPKEDGRKGRTNNPNGRPKIAVDYSLLPRRWTRTEAAAKLLGIHPRTLRHRIDGNKLPDTILVQKNARVTYLKRTGK